MSRAWPLRQAVLLVVTGLVVLSGLAAVGSPAVVGQHAVTQSGAGTIAPGERLNSGATNRSSHTSDTGWAMSRANAANTNHIDTTGPTNPITARWTFTSDANTFSAGPVVRNGTVYFATRYYGSRAGNGTLYAVNAWTGKVRWTFAMDSDGPPNKIAVLRDTVYVGGKEEKVYALDAATGDEFWSFQTSGKVRDLKVANRTLYVGDGERVYALGALRGEPKWRFKAGGTDGYPTGLAVKDSTLYATWRYGNVTALDAQTGAVTWDINIENVNIDNEDDVNWPKDPVVANGLVYVTHHVFQPKFSDSNLYALDAATGEARWTRTARADNPSDSPADGFTIPSVRGDTIYLTGKHLRAVDAQTGADRWRERSLRGNPVLLNDMGYVRTGGTLYTLNPATGAHHARFTPESFNNKWDRYHASMAVLNGSLYTGVGIDEPNTQYRSDRTVFYALGTPEFNYTKLSVTPQSPAVNESVTATVTVRNTGTGPGTFNATLVVNGNVTNATTARLEPRTSQTVTVAHTFAKNGTYTVELGGLTRTIVVGDVAPASTPTPAGDTGSPTPPEPTRETATAAESNSTPTAAATPTPTSGTVPGFGVSVSVVAVVVVVGVLGRRRWT